MIPNNKLTPEQMRQELAKGGKVLPKAERDANLGKFLKDAASKERMYHATGDDFKEFDPNVSSSEGKFGQGIYMTPQARYANFFAGVRGKQGKNAQIMPVHTSIKNPYKIYGHQNIPFNKIDKNKLKDLGHDGVFFYDDRGDLKEAVAFHPTQVKSAIGNRGTYDPSNPDITMAEGGKVEPSQDEMRLALTKRHGLYSPLEKAAIEMPRTKGTGAEFMTELSKRPGFKADEVADRKIPIPEGKMTKLEFLKHLRQHSLPPLQEQILHDMGHESEARDERAQDYYGDDFKSLSPDQQRDVQDWVKKNAAKYQKYQLSGGDNYREMLLKLPESKENPDRNYQSSHWKGNPNVLAHLRLSDREGPDGEKLLHVEEIQSDWHQAGRKKGYRPENHIEQSNKLEDQFAQLGERRFQLLKQAEAMPTHGPEFTNLIDEANSITPKLMQLQEQRDNMQKVINYGVPEAPFKKNWHEMALKHVLHHAAKNGYKGLLITPGSEQADRYGLAGYVDGLNWFSHPTGNRVVSMRLSNDENHDLVVDPSGKIVEQQGINRTPFDGKDLSEVLGENLTKKIFSGERGELSQSDVQIGGEGMKGFYDKIIPTYLNKFGKPHGVKVGETKILKRSFARNEVEHRQAMQDAGLDISSYFHLPPEEREKIDYKQYGVPMHHFPITEPMRTSILKEGMPQYMRGGVVHKAEGGAVLPIEKIKAQMLTKGLSSLQSIGAEEAPSMGVKAFVPTIGRPDNGQMPVGGVDTSRGALPVGGIDMSKMQPGQQMMPTPAGQQPGMDQVPQGDKIPTMDGTGMPPNPNANPNQMGSNILAMTPQGQAMAAMKPQGLKKGGKVSFDEMRRALFANGGSTKGYVKSTPKKPHPEVGKRFTATPQGNLVAPQVFDIMKHENKGSIVPVPYDATTRDNLVTEVSGHQLTEPLLTEAGFDYAMDPKHVSQDIGGASNLGIAGRVQDRINQASKEHQGDVFLAPNTMSDKAENFSHHPAHIVLDLMKQRQLNKKTLKALSDDLRSQPEIHPTTKKKIFPYKNFVGFDHPNLGEQVMKGGHGLETTAGNLRKKMMDRLSLVNIQELLDYNLGDLKASILHPDIASDPKGYMGRTMVRAQAGAPLRLSRHKSYDTDYTGTYAGGFGNRPIETVMPDLFQEVEAELRQRPVKKAKTDAEYRNQVIGALEKRKERVAQPINARVINNAGLYEEGLKAGEFDPKNLDSVLAYYKRKGGYKAGGRVKLHTDQDTMQLALTKKSKKAK